MGFGAFKMRVKGLLILSVDNVIDIWNYIKNLYIKICINKIHLGISNLINGF
jgi:hypothetical protein